MTITKELAPFALALIDHEIYALCVKFYGAQRAYDSARIGMICDKLDAIKAKRAEIVAFKDGKESQGVEIEVGFLCLN